jgi:hypothetical protein
VLTRARTSTGPVDQRPRWFTGETVLALTDAPLHSDGDLGWALGGANPASAAGYALGDHKFASLAGVHAAGLTDRAIDSQQGTAREGDCG